MSIRNKKYLVIFEYVLSAYFIIMYFISLIISEVVYCNKLKSYYNTTKYYMIGRYITFYWQLSSKDQAPDSI